MVPEPLCTVQVCAGLDGCVATVTEYAPLFAILSRNVKSPLAVGEILPLPLSSSTSPVPSSPVMVPPTVYLTVRGQPVSAGRAMTKRADKWTFTDEYSDGAPAG